LKPVKLEYTYSELTFINAVLEEVAFSEPKSSDVPKKLLLSVSRELLERFPINEFSIPKKKYSKTLKYHEACYMLQILKAKMQTITDPYILAVTDLLTNKIEKQL